MPSSVGFAGLALLLAAALLLLGVSDVHGSPAADAAPPSAAEILDAAFAKRYDVDFTSTIELVMRNGTGQERRRRFQAASKRIDGQAHSVGRLTWPEHLRGMTILTIENSDRSHDSFVYLPSLAKVRRISTAQRGDSFFGSDVTYEDLERRRISDYELQSLGAGQVSGEAVYLIEGRSLQTANYARVLFAIARADAAILETRYFKRNQDVPFRILTAPRESLVEQGGHLLPTRLMVENRIRGTTTEVLLNNLQIDPEIDDKVFSVTTLELERSLPGVD